MFLFKNVKFTVGFAILIVCLSMVCQAYAQTGDNLEELKKKASELTGQRKYSEALPILEKLAAAEPNDAETHFHLGFALIAQGNITKDDAARKALRIRARNIFIKAKELGIKDPRIDALIQGIPADGSDGGSYSQNVEADRLMNEAEGLFSQGKLDEALTGYQKALQLDPKLYAAALFSGDIFTHRGDFAQAEIWYQKAIAIDPNRETAYRYSATPFMKQGKYDLALDRYVEAYISEPYNRFSGAGLTQWAQVTGTRLGHPKIEIPTSVSFDEKGNAKIDMDPTAMSGKDDGSFAWLAYGATRTMWRNERFAKAFPQEKTYRHSLAEEADALRKVLELVAENKNVKNLSPALAKLKRLNDEGLLEAYILLGRADRGVAEDHPLYLRQNRDNLRRYVLYYLLAGGGK